MAEKFQGQLKKLVWEENEEGYTPFHSYFELIKQKIHYFNLSKYHEVVREYSVQRLSEFLTSLEQLSKIYATQLGFDLSQRIGMDRYQKN